MKTIHRPVCSLFLLIALTTPLHGAQADSFWQTLFRVTGISATPRSMKDVNGQKSGNIWTVNLAQQSRSQVTRDGGYRFPVFLPADQNILALKGDEMVQVAVHGGEARALHTLQRAVKIVGFNKENYDQVLILRENEDGTPLVGFLSLKTGQVTSIPYDKNSDEDRLMLSHLLGWERVYNDTRVYVKVEIKGSRYKSDVYIKRGNQDEINLSECGGAICDQPSLSHNGRQVVFIQAER